MQFKFQIVSNLVIMMFMLCVSSSGSWASMLNGLAVFNRVGLAHFYDKSCLNEFKFHIVSNLAIMMTMLCISLSAS